jgi:hypothetical protein
MSVFTCHALDDFDTISQCVHHFVGMCDGGIGDAFVLELYGVGQAFAFGLFYMAIMCAIVFWCEEIPFVHRIKWPSASLVGFLMYLYVASHWGECHFCWSQLGH